ncbi:MAG: hypothetical protein IPM85_14970 [Chitinophagaceae bacterium]|nr:hypothetical protein [Chitinophagaceae bacterium]
MFSTFVFQFPALTAMLQRCTTPIEHPTQYNHPRLCRHDPTLFLAHCKAHKTPTQSPPCKELKMPTHSPPTPADEYLSSSAMYFSNKSLLDTKPTHHPTLKNE